jgi:hypothetical protein
MPFHRYPLSLSAATFSIGRKTKQNLAAQSLAAAGWMELPITCIAPLYIYGEEENVWFFFLQFHCIERR